MARLQWDAAGTRTFETGVSQGVLYLPNGSGGYSNGVPWSGLTSIEENRSANGTQPYYLDGVKYIDLPSPSDYAATLKAYTYPDEFLPFDGVGDAGNGLYLDNQVPQAFGLSYKTLVGNDVQSTDYAYKLHFLYGLTATPTDKPYDSQSDSTNPIEFSWALNASAPQLVPGFRPTAHAWLDSRKTDPDFLAAMEDQLYGTDNSLAYLPSLTQLLQMMSQANLINVIDNGDGTFTVTTMFEGFISVDENNIFTITDINATFSDPDTYTITDTR